MTDIDQMLARNQAIWDAALNGPRPAWTPGQEWADHWAEQAAEEKAYRLAQLEDREEKRSA